MRNPKHVIPEKMKGNLKIAGKVYPVGSVKSSDSSPKNLVRAVKKLSKSRFFSLPVYAE